MKPYLLCLMLGCASWEPTQKAVLRRQAEARFQLCLDGRCTNTQACIDASVEWCHHLHHDGTICTEPGCQKPHMESSCGTDGMMTSSPSNRITCRMP